MEEWKEGEEREEGEEGVEGEETEEGEEVEVWKGEREREEEGKKG